MTTGAGLPDPIASPQFYSSISFRRAAAGVIDIVLIFFLMVAVMVLSALLGLFTAGLASIIGLVLFLFTGFLYRFLFLKERSATPGMMALGIEIRDRLGNRLDTPTSLVHTAGFYVSLFFPPILIGGWIYQAINPFHRLAHDILPGTAAINRPV